MQAGKVEFEPCHHHQAVGPMAGIICPSMSVYILENKTHGNRSFSNLNEGYGKVLRYGAYSEEVLDSPALDGGCDGVPCWPKHSRPAAGSTSGRFLAEALHMGDEGHNRNKAGSISVHGQAGAVHCQGCTQTRRSPPRYCSFLGDNALSVLNPVMAACKAMADAAHGIEGSTIVSAMARNGTDFGIRVSGLGDRWFTAPVAVPKGLYFPGFNAEDASGDIGDSTITETAGIGGFAMASAPAIVTFVSGTPQGRD